MCPRRADPELRTALMEAAATLLAAEGPGALTTRRVAATVGTSTSAVYTYFGGMDDLVRALVHEGFARLHETMSLVEPTDDAVADVITLGFAYRRNALDHPHLYLVMFGSTLLGGFALADEDRQHGRYTLQTLVDTVSRACAAGRFRPDDPQLIAHQMWIALHGLVALDLGGYLVEPYTAERCFEAQLVSLMVGAGDEVAAATRSLRAGRERAASGQHDRQEVLGKL
jgi:AcrR family transcriptional regulator